MAGEFGGFWKHPPIDLAGGEGGRLHVVWFCSFSQRLYFLMISPNLLDIWLVFFSILSRYGTLHFFIVLRTSGDGYSLLGSKK